MGQTVCILRKADDRAGLEAIIGDGRRHGTTTLFAALNVLEGTVIERGVQRHHHLAFIGFLNPVEAEARAG